MIVLCYGTLKIHFWTIFSSMGKNMQEDTVLPFFWHFSRQISLSPKHQLKTDMGCGQPSPLVNKLLFNRHWTCIFLGEHKMGQHITCAYCTFVGYVLAQVMCYTFYKHSILWSLACVYKNVKPKHNLHYYRIEPGDVRPHRLWMSFCLFSPIHLHENIRGSVHSALLTMSLLLKKSNFSKLFFLETLGYVKYFRVRSDKILPASLELKVAFLLEKRVHCLCLISYIQFNW